MSRLCTTESTPSSRTIYITLKITVLTKEEKTGKETADDMRVKLNVSRP